MVSERELWKKISNGDPEAFDAFYRECAPRLLGFLRHLLSDDQAAEDTMQNAFTEIWRNERHKKPHSLCKSFAD